MKTTLRINKKIINILIKKRCENKNQLLSLRRIKKTFNKFFNTVPMSKQDVSIQPYKVVPDDVFIQFVRVDQDADKVVLYNVIICQNGVSNDEGQEYFTFVHILIEDFEAFVVERFCEVNYLSRVGYEDDQHIKVDFLDWWAGQDIDVLKKYCQIYIAEGKEIETGTEFTGLSSI